jgi:two-component system chemotaxis response regulator CheB
MGRDGSQGLKKMRRAGAVTACQDEASSLIYGMPKVAISTGAAQHEVSLDHVASFILNPPFAAQKKTRDHVRYSA